MPPLALAQEVCLGRCLLRPLPMAASVVMLTSSMTWTYVCWLLRYTEMRGRSAVPLSLVRIFVWRFWRLFSLGGVPAVTVDDSTTVVQHDGRGREWNGRGQLVSVGSVRLEVASCNGAVRTGRRRYRRYPAQGL